MTTAPPDADAAAPQAALDDALRRLGPAWRVVRATSLPDAAGARRPFVALALLHPALGVALLDLAPRITPDAAGTLCAALRRTALAPPIVHRVLTREHLARLPDILDYAFGWETPFDGPPGWVETVAQHLGAAPRLVPTAVPPPPRRSRAPWAIAAAGIALVAAGLLILLRAPPGAPALPAPRVEAVAPAAPQPVPAEAPTAEAPPPARPHAAPPPPPPAPPPRRIEDAETPASLLRRGEASLALGDLAAARALLGRAAEAGSAAAATALGRSYDPDLLAGSGQRGGGDRALAAQWYRTGLVRGDAAAAAPLQRLTGRR